eukprot:Anaeramoba_ignava/c16768_g1_i1.p1 GENE.c16768_g1_i1~~c16768_g1_i1.p1  ORF type:complete len:273 (+),score=52.77 c16768_g1_i1:244-1062(+)
MIYRSASLGNASEKDIKELKQRVKLIIDLRRSEEIAVEPGEHKIYQEFPFEEKKTEEEKEDQNETYFDVEKKSAIQMSIMTGDFFERALKKESRKEKLKVVGMKTFNFLSCGGCCGFYKMNVNGKIYQLVMGETIGTFYIKVVDFAQPELRHVLMHYTRKENYPILVHCSLGKDRTGVIVALLLAILGLSIDVIAEDYSKTRQLLSKETVDMIKKHCEIKKINFEDIISSDESFIRNMFKHIDEKYKSLDNYFDTIGITKKYRDQIREILLN